MGEKSRHSEDDLIFYEYFDVCRQLVDAKTPEEEERLRARFRPLSQKVREMIADGKLED